MVAILCNKPRRMMPQKLGRFLYTFVSICQYCLYILKSCLRKVAKGFQGVELLILFTESIYWG